MGTRTFWGLQLNLVPGKVLQSCLHFSCSEIMCSKEKVIWLVDFWVEPGVAVLKEKAKCSSRIHPCSGMQWDAVIIGVGCDIDYTSFYPGKEGRSKTIS